MMNWNDGTWGAGNFAAMGIAMLLLTGLLVLGAIWLVRYVGNDSPSAQEGMSHRSRPDEELARRFARGDIDEDEFVRRQAVLHGSRPGSGTT
jgi:putative membrane protein